MSSRLRLAARVSALIAAPASVGFMLRAAHRNPSVLLLVLMAIWVFAPFLALLWAIRVSEHWTEFSRKALCILTLFLSCGALVVYTIDALGPPHAKAAAPFVAVPLASWIVSVIVFGAVRLTPDSFK
jgi:peptidoglycan/LPS O-acetylase OafA/YrhL